MILSAHHYKIFTCTLENTFTPLPPVTHQSHTQGCKIEDRFKHGHPTPCTEFML